MGFVVFIILLLIVVGVLASCIKIVPQAHAYVVERLGAYQGTWGVGMHFKVPFIDKINDSLERRNQEEMEKSKAEIAARRRSLQERNEKKNQKNPKKKK